MEKLKSRTFKNKFSKLNNFHLKLLDDLKFDEKLNEESRSSSFMINSSNSKKKKILYCKK